MHDYLHVEANPLRNAREQSNLPFEIHVPPVSRLSGHSLAYTTGPYCLCSVYMQRVHLAVSIDGYTVTSLRFLPLAIAFTAILVHSNGVNGGKFQNLPVLSFRVPS